MATSSTCLAASVSEASSESAQQGVPSATQDEGRLARQDDGRLLGGARADLCTPKEAIYIDSNKVPQAHVRWVLGEVIRHTGVSRLVFPSKAMIKGMMKRLPSLRWLVGTRVIETASSPSRPLAMGWPWQSW